MSRIHPCLCGFVGPSNKGETNEFEHQNTYHGNKTRGSRHFCPWELAWAIIKYTEVRVDTSWIYQGRQIRTGQPQQGYGSIIPFLVWWGSCKDRSRGSQIFTGAVQSTVHFFSSFFNNRLYLQGWSELNPSNRWGQGASSREHPSIMINENSVLVRWWKQITSLV